MTLKIIMGIPAGAGPPNAHSPGSPSSSGIGQQPQPPQTSPPPTNPPAPISAPVPHPSSQLPTPPTAATTTPPPAQQLTSPLPTNTIVIPLQSPVLQPLSSAPPLPSPHLPPLPKKIPFPFAPTRLSRRLLEPRPSYLPQIPPSSSTFTHNLRPPHPPLLYALSDFTFTDASGAPAFTINEYERMGLAHSSSSASSEDEQIAFLRRLIQPRVGAHARGRIITIRSKSSQLTPSAATTILLSGVYKRRRAWDTWAFDIWFLRSLAACEAVNSGGRGKGIRTGDDSDSASEHDSSDIDGISGQGGVRESWGMKRVVGGVSYYALSLPYPKVSPPSTMTTSTTTSSVPRTSITDRRFSVALTNHNKGSRVSNSAPWTVTSIGAPVALPVDRYGPMDIGGEKNGVILVGEWVRACACAVVGCWEEAIGGVVGNGWKREDTILTEQREVPVEDLLRRWSRQLHSVRIDLEVQGVQPLAEWQGDRDVEELVRRVKECEKRVSLLIAEIAQPSISGSLLATQNPLFSPQGWLLALGMAIGVTAGVTWTRRRKS